MSVWAIDATWCLIFAGGSHFLAFTFTLKRGKVQHSAGERRTHSFHFLLPTNTLMNATKKKLLLFLFYFYGKPTADFRETWHWQRPQRIWKELKCLSKEVKAIEACNSLSLEILAFNRSAPSIVCKNKARVYSSIYLELCAHDCEEFQSIKNTIFIFLLRFL